MLRYLESVSMVHFSNENSIYKLLALVHDTVPPTVTLMVSEKKVMLAVDVEAQIAVNVLHWQLRLYQAVYLSYNHSQTWRQHKENQNHSNRDETIFWLGRTYPMFTCVLRRCVASTVLVLLANFTEGADSVRFIGGRFGAQMREDKECLFSTVANYGRVWRIGGCRKGSSSSLLLYVHRDHKDYEGRGA